MTIMTDMATPIMMRIYLSCEEGIVQILGCHTFISFHLFDRLVMFNKAGGATYHIF